MDQFGKSRAEWKAEAEAYQKSREAVRATPRYRKREAARKRRQERKTKSAYKRIRVIKGQDWNRPDEPDMPWDFVGNAAKAAGRAVSTGLKTVSKVTKVIGDGIEQIPVVGDGIGAVYDVTISGPVDFAKDVASGKRIDRAAMKHLERTMSSAKTLAPYVQTIVATVPGVGTGVAGAIGASIALAEGKDIDEAMLEGIRGSVPGGAVGRACFEITEGVLSGQSLDEMALDALPIPAESRKYMSSALKITKALAKGKTPSKELLTLAYDQLPADAKKTVDSAVKKGTNKASAVVTASARLLPKDAGKAIKIGIAVGNAKSIQRREKKGLEDSDTRDKLHSKAKEVVAKNPVVKEVRSMTEGKSGFDLGIGIMAHQGVSPTGLLHVRKNLEPIQRKGFDLALATHSGMVTNRVASRVPPRVQAGYYAAMGAVAMPPELRVEIAESLSKDGGMREGALTAFEKSIDERDHWWNRLVEALGMG